MSLILRVALVTGSNPRPIPDTHAISSSPSLAFENMDGLRARIEQLSERNETERNETERRVNPIESNYHSGLPTLDDA